MPRDTPLPEGARRARAARELRGLSQRTLARRLADDGLPLRLLGQLERGEIRVGPAHAKILSAHLDVPEHWFLAPDAELFTDQIPPEQPTWFRAVLERLERRRK